MAKVIYKYQLHFNEFVTLELPKDSRVLTVQSHNNVPVLWAVVDLEQPEFVQRKFAVRFTGETIEGSEGVYIGTLTAFNDIVVHVFEI